ncbi:MAG TPA: serine hydrolase [Saprospiraceae bacterium]|nr:serine hydrolase [Saprospiraceae bacterium]HPI08628.1 serine hydrolase [Saprospiraceae bacterium]
MSSLRVVLLCSLLSFFGSGLFSQNTPLYFPPLVGSAWQTIPPASLGFCPERIDSLYHYLEITHTKSFILLKDGKIVLEHYFDAFTQDSLWYWASAGKSLTAFLVGQAQEEGLLNIQDTTSKYLGTGWTSCTPAQEAAITIRHQITMTSGLDDSPVTDDPEPADCTDPACLQYLAPAGTRWAYHNAVYHLVHEVIEEASGLNINQFTKTRLFDKTGMKGFWIDHIMYGKARDMARYGLLTLAGGAWNGDTLLHDQNYLYAMSHPSQTLNPSYGYLWWLNGQSTYMVPGLQLNIPGPLIPNAPADMFAALGKNDQKIHVVPSKGWVVVRQGNDAGLPGLAGQVPIAFDNQMWGYLNTLQCGSVATSEAEASSLKIWPNPSAGDWQIEFPGDVEGWSLYDAQGRNIQSAGSLRIDGTNLEPGVYTLKVTAAGKVTVQKLMKMK